MNEILRICGALYDETRIRILAFLLKNGECCVCELAESMSLGQSRLSRHLGILSDGGFVTARRNGKWVYYGACENLPEPLAALIRAVEALNIELPEKIDACDIFTTKEELKMSKKRVLFVCVHNSARSQMAEAFLNAFGNDGYEAFSAGLEPGVLNPLVVEAMGEVGIDISDAKAKSVFDLFKNGDRFHYVITVCDGANAERCPVFPGITHRVAWSFDDPSSFDGTQEEKMARVRAVRDAVKAKVQEWIASPTQAEF